MSSLWKVIFNVRGPQAEGPTAKVKPKLSLAWLREGRTTEGHETGSQECHQMRSKTKKSQTIWDLLDHRKKLQNVGYWFLYTLLHYWLIPSLACDNSVSVTRYWNFRVMSLKTCRVCWLFLYLFLFNLTQTRDSCGEEASIEESCLWDWPVGNSAGHFCDYWLLWEGSVNCGQHHSWPCRLQQSKRASWACHRL